MSNPNSSVSYSPLEVPAPIEGGRNYVDYWPRHEAVDPELPSTRKLHAAIADGAAFVRDPDGCNRYQAISRWDASLGSFNHMQHGQGDLLRGAALLIESSHDGAAGEFPVVQHPNPKDTVDAFLDIALQLGDMADLLPSREMRLGGQLIHKAALIEKEPERQSALFDVAEFVYERCYGPDTPWTADKILTGRFLHDIRFHRLSQNIRAAVRARQGVATYRRQAAELLRVQAQDLMQYKKLMDTECRRERQGIYGPASELLATIAVRHMEYVAKDPKGNHAQIRTGFDSEEHPDNPKGMWRKRAFDLVYTRVNQDDHVVGARMWQMKSGYHVNEDSYHPAIDVVYMEGLPAGRMFDLAKSLRHVYAQGQYETRISGLPVISAAVKPFMQPAAKAA